MVVYSHSYTLLPSEDGFFPFNRQIFGTIAVNMFAFISGYYIFKSVKRSISWRDFFYKRFIRLFPQLFVCIISTFFVFYYISDESFQSFLKHRETLYYLLNIIFIGRYTIPIIFNDNYYPNVANGSLWVLRYLIVMYIVSWVIYKIQINQKTRMAITIFSIILSLMVYLYLSGKSSVSFLVNISRIGFYYLVGYVSSMMEISLLKTKTFFFLLPSLFLVFAGFASVPITLFMVYVILAFNERLINSHGVITIIDISYGVFIYAFPIQQLLLKYIYFKEGFSFFIASSILSILIAYMSYFFIEKSRKKSENKFVKY
jgi:peptidoglycan/LPS O-acetylase OafA/YrhL